METIKFVSYTQSGINYNIFVHNGFLHVIEGEEEFRASQPCAMNNYNKSSSCGASSMFRSYLNDVSELNINSFVVEGKKILSVQFYEIYGDRMFKFHCEGIEPQAHTAVEIFTNSQRIKMLEDAAKL
jgi:hypothetical protein